MTEPLSTIVAAKILDQLLGQAIGKSVDSLLGGASKALKDARAELDKETAQRAVRLTLIVQKAAEELQPALEQIKLETGQDHSALFEHLPFLTQIADALLFGTRLDLPALQAQYLELYSDEHWPGLSRPLIKFFERLNRLLEDEEPWKSALLEYRIEAQIAGLDANTLRLVETAQQIASRLDALPDTMATALEQRETVRLDAWEKRYLEGLYSRCNELPLERERDTPVDAADRRTFRLQRVYVDLDIKQPLTLERVLDRLQVPQTSRQQVKAALQDFGPAETGQRDWEGDLSADLTRTLSRELRQGRLVGQKERAEKLKQLGIEPEALEYALKPVTAFEAIRDNTQIVLLGDPGSGKSTLTRRIAGMLASVAAPGLPADETDWHTRLGGIYDQWRLPIRIALSRWATRLPANSRGEAKDLIDECLHVLRETGDMGGERAGTYLMAQINNSPPTAVILLDGLDEVPDKVQRKTLLSAVKRFCESYSNVRLIVTCRVRPYETDASYRLSLPAFTLAPLSDESIATFLQRWHGELAWVLRSSDKALRAERDLAEAIADPARTELHEMGGTPLLLTMMARVNYDSGLPGSRAELYEDYIKKLLYEWETKRQDDNDEKSGIERLLDKAGLKPDQLHKSLNKLAYSAHGQRGRREKVAIPASDLSSAFKALFLTEHPDQRSEAAAWAEDVIDFIDSRSGLLYATEQRSFYEFPHLTFQEYLAARAMASTEHTKRIKEKIDDPNWREVVLLALGYQIFVQNKSDDALDVLCNRMPSAVTTEVERRRVLLLGEAYVQLLKPSRARQSDNERTASVLIATMPELLRQAMQHTALDATTGDVKNLARQRLDAGLLLADLNPETPAMDDFVSIHDAGFDIGRYPVTNREFKRFMDGGGYDQDKPWWSKAALEELPRYSGGWPATPRSWDDSRFNHPTQPVVGISWYEANAYCDWLTRELQEKYQEVRLPTLEEWKKATGPEIYPWGKGFDPTFANTRESDLSQTTPVDMYPDGATPDGVWDMAGNVWEWTASQYEDLDAYWIAGGAWYNDADGVVSAARGRNLPWLRLNLIGFRVLAVPISRSG